jgi:hypothetical protein
MYQELLDALMYSTQALLEGNKLAEVFFDVLVALSAQMAYQLREVTECTEKRSTPSAE